MPDNNYLVAADGNDWSSGQFIEDVRKLYEVYGFEVRSEKKTAAADFMIAKAEAGIRSELNVLCIEDRPVKPEIERIIERIQRARAEGRRTDWIIVASRPLADEIERKLDQADIQCSSYPHLLNELVPLDEYLPGQSVEIAYVCAVRTGQYRDR